MRSDEISRFGREHDEELRAEVGSFKSNLQYLGGWLQDFAHSYRPFDVNVN